MKRILVADDSVTIQKVIALTFADEPFEVQSVGTGSEALELAKSWKPDIVLADVIMPQMNGYELCRAVKQLEEASSVPVLLLAGTFEAFDEEEARSVGADDFITKPFESGELIEKVKTLIGEIPAAPAAEQAATAGDGLITPEPAAMPEAAPEPPVMQEAAPEPAAMPEVTPEPAAMPEAAPQEGAPSPAPADTASEPDIWDILSESGDDARTQSAEGDAQAPGFGPIEGGGVVDVGSFDVGIGRPESQPVTTRPPTEMPVEPPQVPDVPESAPEPGIQPPSAAPAVEDQQQDMDEKSRVENMEKDFFGFETGAVEEVPETDILDEAVEEVTFEMEQPQDSPEVVSPEASFVVPEPAEDQVIATGETISPDFMAPEPAPDPIPSSSEASLVANGMGDGTADKPKPAVPVPDPIEMPGFAPEPAAEPEIALEPEPSFAEVPPAAIASAEATVDMGGADDNAEGRPEAAPAPVPEASADLELQPEPPLELSVDLTPELPEGFSPQPAPEQAAAAPLEMPSEPPASIPPDPVPEPAPEVPAQAAVDAPDDEAIKRIVEEKVEKIVWEVVPEMAEVIIREAIQKIKNGS